MDKFDGPGLVVQYGGDIPYSNRKERNQRTLIPIDDQLESVLLRWLAIRPDQPEDEALFTETKDSWRKRIKPANIRYIFEKYGRKHGYYSTDNEISNFTPIALRYFFKERFRGPLHHREYILGSHSDSNIDFPSLEKRYRETIFHF